MSMWTWSVMRQQRFILTPVCSEWVLQPIREWGHLSVDASQRSPGPQRLLYALLLLAPRHRRLLPVTRGEDTHVTHPSHHVRSDQSCFTCAGHSNVFCDNIQSVLMVWSPSVGFSMFKPANTEKAWIFWLLSVSRNNLRVSGWKLCSVLFPW